MKKIFGIRKHRDRDRELDERYRDEMDDYEEGYDEDDEYYEDDEDFDGDEDYYEDDEAPDEDEEFYEDEDLVDDDEYYEDNEAPRGRRRKESEDYPEDEFYEEDELPEDVDVDRYADEAPMGKDGIESAPEIEDQDSDVELNECKQNQRSESEADSEEEDISGYNVESFADEVVYEEKVKAGRKYESSDDYSDDNCENSRNEDIDDLNFEDERDGGDDRNFEGGRDYEDDGDFEDDRDYDDDRDYEDDRDYDEDYDDEDDYEDNRRSGYRRDEDEESVGARILNFIANTSAVERIAAFFALLILAGGIATAVFYSSAMKGNKELESFNEIGTSLSDMDIIGQSGLIAVADAEKARSMAVQLITEDEQEEEEVVVADDAKDVTIKMTVTSIKSDLKVKFINSQTGKLVANLPLEIEVVNPDGSTVTYNDHDQDGIIYKKDLTAGEYKVTPKPLGAGYENYNLEIATKSVTVKDTVEMKAVDVSNEVKKESQVNVAAEDTQVKAEVESKLQDTVEWVESSKTAVGETNDGTYSYEEIKKEDIVRPDSASMVGARKWMFMALTTGASTDASLNTENGDENKKETSEEASNTGDSSQTDTPSSEEPQKEEPQQEETPKEKDKISISVGNSTMTVGDEQTVNISGTSASVTLTPSDPGVVSVSGTTIKAEKAGTATIKATAENCEPAEISITIKEKETKLSDFSVNGNTISVKVGENGSVGASASSSITYKSNDESIATVDSNGNVTGKKEGSTKITLTADGYNDGYVNVTVAKADDKTISGVPASLSMKVGEEYKLSVSGPSSITYASSKTEVATIDNGVIKAVAEGKTTITLTADGYSKAEFEVTVAAADAKEMKVKANKISVKVSESAQIEVTEPNSSKVTYKSDNTNIATVDANGKVTGVSVGTAHITITADSSVGNYKNCDITIEVTAKEGNKVPMSISKINIVEGQSIKVSSSDSNVAIKLESANTNIVTISDNTTITGKAAGETTVKVTAAGYTEATISVKVFGKDETLKDKNGNEIWILKQDNSYYKATYEDYYTRDKFFVRKASTTYKYTGWQTIDGKTYFFTKDGNKVTGEQVIQGAKYTFGADGALAQTAGAMGIDVSKWNGNIDWAAVKNSGVNFVIIRCGYRGSSQGALIEDSKFKSNINGALNAGLRVGVYFFTQAVNEVEAVEEASMVINLIKGYNLSFPVYLDVEGSNGRGDAISAGQRTANIKAFCGTISNAGYKAGVYANKTWFTSKINTSQITNYKIWLAQYASAVTYNASRYDMWQYSSKGRVTGISGNVDLNICY